jgi:hypothetical protein
VDIREVVSDLSNLLAEAYRGYPRGVNFVQIQILPNLAGSGNVAEPSNTIRCQFRLVGTIEYFYVQTHVPLFLQRRESPDFAELIVRDIRYEVDQHLGNDDMAQWNQRPDQRLRQQENQRRQARGQPTTEPTMDGVHPSLAAVHVGFDAARATAGIAIQDWLNQEGPTRRLFGNDANGAIEYATVAAASAATTGGGMWAAAPATTTNRSFYYTNGNSTNGTNAIFGEPVSEAPLTVTESQLKTMLRDLIKESLDLRLSVQESDGEITVEAEVYFDGELITSDSDMIQL